MTRKEMEEEPFHLESIFFKFRQVKLPKWNLLLGRILLLTKEV